MRGTKSALSSLMMAAALAMLAPGQHAAAQTPLGSTFTYQGELIDGGTPVNGTVDLTFRLYDAAAAGNLIDIDVILAVPVTDGRLTVTLDFGVSAFNGDRRWLEIAVGATTLGPRQEITVAPYALQTRGLFVDSSLNVGIGTTTPGSTLHVAVGGTQLEEASPRVSGRFPSLSLYDDSGDAPDRNWAIGGAWFSEGDFAIFQSDAQGGDPRNAGTARFYIDPTGNVGIGTTSPSTALHVDGGTDVSLAGGGFAVLGSTVSTNLALDNNEIMARNNGAAADLILNFEGGDILLGGPNGGNVGIGTTTPTSRLEVRLGAIRASRSDDQYLEVVDDSSQGGRITGHSREDNKKPLIISNVHDGGGGAPAGETFIRFQVGDELSPINALHIAEDGSVGIGTTNLVCCAPLQVVSSLGTAGSFISPGRAITASTTDDNDIGCIVAFSLGANGLAIRGKALGSNSTGVLAEGTQWDFFASGAGTNYGPFTGGHEVRLADDFPDDAQPGMIVSVTGETQVRRLKDGTACLSSTLPTVQLAHTENDRAVFGVLVAADARLHKDHWYKAKETERFATVNALGEGRVWVTDVSGEIEVGDYITTSAIPGYGQRQYDDVLRSCTLGKAIESVAWDTVTQTVEHDDQTFRVHLIAVVYTSG